MPPPSQYFHLFIHENGAIKEVRKMGYKNLYYLPLAVNPRRYRKIPQEDKVLDKYRCEVSFLGNAGPRWEENGYGRHEHLGGFLSQEKIREMLWLESTMPVR
ncbi:TPA: hypothetical protein DCX15_02475 [bacterium]|nr:hypothetical protein [bacterium]